MTQVARSTAMAPRILLTAGLLLGSVAASGATEARPREKTPPPIVCPVCSRVGNKVDYGSKAGYTLIRGATNMALGWTELIRQPAEEVKTHGGRNTRNVLSGIVKGIGQGMARTASGAAELFTFWVPKVQGTYMHFSNDCPLCMGQQTATPPPPPRRSRIH